LFGKEQLVDDIDLTCDGT